MFALLRTTILTVALAFGAGAVMAQDYNKDLAAAQAGDYATALKEWRPLAEKGDDDAQRNIGLMYSNGYGVLQDYAEAMKWYRLAAEQGIAEAQYNLANGYNKGEGVLQDYAEAVKWYRLAAEQGYVDAQYNLSFIYENGRSVLLNNVRAHVWYNIASANGDKEAGEWRDKTAAKMISAGISKSQSMAREYMKSNFKNCGW